MSIKTSAWVSFPHPHGDFDYADNLEASWERLHAGDHEPFADAHRVEHLQSSAKGEIDGSPGELCATLQEGWVAYHRGDFAQAVDIGLDLGTLGNTLAAKAAGIYAVYLEKDELARLDIYDQVAQLGEAYAQKWPEEPNGYYFHAFGLGRYSQGISIAKALSQGLGGKVKDALDTCLELDPAHPDAHIAAGLYHAEIIDKVGKMVGGVTYGAKSSIGEDHFRTALDNNPDSAIARIEYGNGLLMMYGRKKLEQATDLYVEASEHDPADAMEKLDVELARSELE